MRVPGAWLLLVAAAGSAAAEPMASPGTIPVEAGDEADAVPALQDVEWSLSGNLQYDALGRSDLPTDRENPGELRRAGLAAIVDVRGDWRFRLGVDLAASVSDRSRGGALREASVEYRGAPVYFEMGRMVEPFGLLQGGSRSASMMERPAALGLGTGYGIGGAANWRAERWAVTGGVFAPAENDVFFGGRAEQSLTVRVTGVPLRFDDALVHAGLALSRRQPEDEVLQFTAIPESVLLRGLDASSQRLITEDFQLLGLELAAQWGPVLARAEFIQARLGDTIPIDGVFSPGFEPQIIQPTYQGQYAEASWVLTGERRDYSVRHGMFSGIYPERPVWRDGHLAGFGALELAVRTGGVDLTDETGGGEKSRVSSAAVAWYPVEFAKLIVEELQADEDGGDGSHDSASALQARVQLSYSFP